MAFDTTPTQAVGRFERFVEQVIRKIVLDVVANLVKAPSEGGTPVDTGWARSNWLVNLAVPPAGTLGSRDAVQTHPSPLAAMLSYKLRFGQVYMSNNVPYITRLNDGYSKQAPAGFVQAAILKALTEDLANLRVVA